MCFLAFVDGFAWNLQSVVSWRFVALMIDPLADIIYLLLGYEVGRIVKMRAVTRCPRVSVVKISIGCAMDITASSLPL